MLGIIELNAQQAEAALRNLELVRAQVTYIEVEGANLLNTVELGELYHWTFDSIYNADQHVESARRDLQQALTDALLADAGLTMSDLVEIVGLPVGELSVDELLVAVKRTDALDDIRNEINRGDDAQMNTVELNLVLKRLSALSDVDRQFVLAHLSDVDYKRLFKNISSGGDPVDVPIPSLSTRWDDDTRTAFYEMFQCLSFGEKARIAKFSPYLEVLATAELRTSGDQAAKKALDELRTSDAFADLTFEQRIALLAQSANHPFETPIKNLARLATKEWFRDSTIENSQRSAKMIAYASMFAFDNDAQSQRIIVGNTLDQILGENSTIRLEWEPLAFSAYDVEYGNTVSHDTDDTHIIRLNSLLLDAGNEDVLNSKPEIAEWTDVRHLVLHTVAHEVNHVVTVRKTSETFEHFMDEYRAAYVGFIAEFGREPNREEARDRIGYLLTPNDGAYDSLSEAMNNPEEGSKIAAFVAPVWGDGPQTAENIVGNEDTPGLLGTDPKDSSAPAPAPVPVNGGDNNLTNGCAPAIPSRCEPES